LKYFAVAVLAIFVILALCLGRPAFREETRIRNHADPIAEQMLMALSQNDYQNFSLHFDEHMRNTVSEAEFDQFSQDITQSYGVYQSKSHFSTTVYPQTSMVKYIAQFSNVSGGIDVTIEFSKTEGSDSVHGFSVVQAGWLTR
jgi:hypothetical protein